MYIVMKFLKLWSSQMLGSLFVILDKPTYKQGAIFLDIFACI
jgi:hypothetical protein